MLQISLLDSKLVKFTPSELQLLSLAVGGFEVMVEKGKWWCEYLDVEVLKTLDAVIVVKYLSDSGLSVMYEGIDCSVEDVLSHCINTLNFFNPTTKEKSNKQLDTVYNVFRDKKIKAPSYTIKING